MLITY
jgi:PAS domain-containing protein